MQLDWITVSAQIINFLVLVFLLKRFLYTPIITAMDAREKKATQRLKDANQREADAESQRIQYVEKTLELDNIKEQHIADAKQSATKLKQELLENARLDVTQAHQDWITQTQQEKDNFLKSWQQQTAKSVLNTTRHIIQGLANAELEDQLIETFIQQLQSHSFNQKSHMTKANNTVDVLSSFELNPMQQEAIAKILHAKLTNDIDLSFRTTNKIDFGIEMNIDKHRLGWSLDNYLEDLSTEFDLALSGEEST